MLPSPYQKLPWSQIGILFDPKQYFVTQGNPIYEIVKHATLTSKKKRERR